MEHGQHLQALDADKQPKSKGVDGQILLSKARDNMAAWFCKVVSSTTVYKMGCLHWLRCIGESAAVSWPEL